MLYLHKTYPETERLIDIVFYNTLLILSCLYVLFLHNILYILLTNKLY